VPDHAISPPAQVVMLAQEEARRLGHNFVGTEQLLLGLVGESTGVC
jgi:ATP-dependent Clp protease ATP-binding subunit ClpC